MDDASKDALRIALLNVTGEIVSAYMGHNALALADVPRLITDVHAALRSSAEAREDKDVALAESIRRSVTPDHVFCLEDGLPFKSLRRHLRNAHGMSPAEYRHKWHLPLEHPIVAPNYSAARSRVAKANTLGKWDRRKNAKNPKLRRPGASSN